ncbi:hypothetical protein M2404_004070 [Rheinheimera pacifica]|nr:hypothetical protein [Rheinheimera pacifica]
MFGGKGVLRRIVSAIQSDGAFTVRFDCGHETRCKLSLERNMFVHLGLFNGYCKIGNDAAWFANELASVKKQK